VTGFPDSSGRKSEVRIAVKAVLVMKKNAVIFYYFNVFR